MTFTVLWTPSAEQHLADVWLNAVDRDAITAASVWVDHLLARDPEARGHWLFDTVRALAVPPLGVEFEVDVQNLTVWVLSAWDTTKTTP